MTPNRRVLIRRATDSVEPSSTAGGTTAATAANATVPLGAFITACVTLPATDMLVATNSHSQKHRVAPRVLASGAAADALIDPLSTRTQLAAFTSGCQRRAAAGAPCSAR